MSEVLGLIIYLVVVSVALIVALVVSNLIERRNFRKELKDDSITCKDIREARANNQYDIVQSYMEWKRNRGKEFTIESLLNCEEELDNADENKS